MPGAGQGEGASAAYVVGDFRRPVEWAERISLIDACAVGRAKRRPDLHEGLVQLARSLAVAGLNELLREHPCELAIAGEGGMLDVR